MEAGKAGMVRVVVVDDDDINRCGINILLSGDPRIVVIAAVDHDQAITASIAWREVDVAVVDAADHRQEFDQFPGVGVVEHIRMYASAARPVIVVMTGHFFDDAVRRRMREARADFFYHRGELGSAEALRAAVLYPERARRPVPAPTDPETQFRTGVTEASRVNHAVRYAGDRDLATEIRDRDAPRSRRWLRLRGEFNANARLATITTDGRVPDRPQELPSLSQISRFLSWATRVKDNAPGVPDHN